jgi:hypothetical protein
VWAATNESVFYTESEEVSVSDHCISSVAVGYHQVSGRSLLENKVFSYLPAFVAEFLLDLAFGRQNFHEDRSSMYLYKSTFYMIWPYDDRGRLIGENIWEPEPRKAEIIKLAPADVLTTKEASRLLAPLIKPLPSLDEMLTNRPAHKRGAVLSDCPVGVG